MSLPAAVTGAFSTMTPLGWAALAVQGVQALSSAAGARTDAKNTRSAALADFNNQQAALNAQSQETSEAAVEKKSALALKQEAEASRLNVAVGESGVGGFLSQRLQAASKADVGRDIASVDKQADATQAQIARERQAVTSQTQSTLNKARAPSLLTPFLSIAGSALSIAANQKKPIK